MTKEIKEILNYMKQYVENKYEHDSEPMLNYKDLQIVLDYITNLEQENERLKDELYSTNQVVNELLDSQSRNEKAIEDIDLVIEIIKQQPTEDDSWILNRLNGFKYLLNGGDEEWKNKK